MLRRSQSSLTPLIAFLVIVFSAMTFWLPRETFDPHLGLDYDIFCQVFATISAVDTCDTFSIELVPAEDVKQDDRGVDFSPIHVSLVLFIIRAPPSVMPT